MTVPREVREWLARQLDWEDAHIGYGRAVADFPTELRGVVPPGVDHSGWHQLEHMRLTQKDILDFCIDPDYVEPVWPDDYWPATIEPPSEEAWEASIVGFRQDLAALKRLALDESVDLLARVPAGTGQVYLRELLVAADHNAYQLGQLLILRRVIGAWS